MLTILNVTAPSVAKQEGNSTSSSPPLSRSSSLSRSSGRPPLPPPSPSSSLSRSSGVLYFLAESAEVGVLVGTEEEEQHSMEEEEDEEEERRAQEEKEGEREEREGGGRSPPFFEKEGGDGGSVSGGSVHSKGSSGVRWVPFDDDDRGIGLHPEIKFNLKAHAWYKFVLKLRCLGWDFGVYAPVTPCPVLTYPAMSESGTVTATAMSSTDTAMSVLARPCPVLT
eukprot:2381152-Rhodomonas_salina.1